MEPPPLPDAKQAEYLSAHTCSWLAAEFQCMAKDRAAEHDENFRFRAEMASITNSIQDDLRSLTNKTGDSLIRLIQENRLIKSLLDTILAELRVARRTPPAHNNSLDSPEPSPSPTGTHSMKPPSPASTQAVDIPPFGKCPPENTPASGSGSEGSTPGPDNPPPPKSARPNRYNTKNKGAMGGPPEDTAMRYSDPHLNKGCKPYSVGNLSSSIHAAPNEITQEKPKGQGTQGDPSPPPPATKPIPRSPFHTPTEEFLDAINLHVEQGTMSPDQIQHRRNLYQTELARHLTNLRGNSGTTGLNPPPLPAGSISPVPDPDTSIPDAEAPPPPTFPAPPIPHVIDLSTPQAPALAPLVDLVTPEPTTSSATTPTPPWPKREYSPGREETAKTCAQVVHRNKGWQAVQGASPLHDTEDSLRALPRHPPQPTGPFGTYTPTVEEYNDEEEPSPDTPKRRTGGPLAFGTISPPARTDTPITNNLAANEEHRHDLAKDNSRQCLPPYAHGRLKKGPTQHNRSGALSIRINRDAV